MSFRVAVFLSIALLPIGLMAVLQTRDLTREVRSRSELSLLAITEQATSDERQIIERAFGAAEALSAVLRMIRDDSEACSSYLAEYLNSTSRYSYVGFAPTDGVVRCASNRQFVDFSGDPLFASLLESPRQVVAPLSETADPSDSAVVVYNPVMSDEGLLGFTVISVLPKDLFVSEKPNVTSRPTAVFTFNAIGQLLTADGIDPGVALELPTNQQLSMLPNKRTGTFFDQNQDGTGRVYVHSEIVPGIAFALGVWALTEEPVVGIGWQVPTALFPLLMWMVSLLVAFLAVHRLVVRHLQKLSREMRRFAIDRRLPAQIFDKSRPFEMQELEYSFQSMAYALLNDEARMENALREKNVLLKEVHHRVKNNLQMISSIMNMKIRKSQSEETKGTIRRLQDRVLGLATVHRNLYQAEDLSKTSAGALLQEIFTHLIAARKAMGARPPQATMELDDIVMFPDQAVPFSLLASEIATNCLNRASPPEDGAPPWVDFLFDMPEPGIIRLQCRNSIAPDHDAEAISASGGLGAQLIKAFSVQLGATHEVEVTTSEYVVTVLFPAQEFENETQDY